MSAVCILQFLAYLVQGEMTAGSGEQVSIPAKDFGEMVTFHYDMIYSFSNGESEILHDDGAVSKN